MVSRRHEYMSNVWRDGLFGEEGRVVFCTGGAGTICSAQVRALVYLGANACIVGRSVEKTQKIAKDLAGVRNGAKVLGIGAVDVRDIQSLEKAAQQCAEELGGIDYVIAGAAGNFLAPIHNLSTNAFKSVLDIDVLGSYNTAKATLPYLIASASKNREQNGTEPFGAGGRIIFVSATMHYIGTPLQSHVCAAKAAVDALAHSVCIEQGPLGLTSNVISPGPIADTEGTSRLFSENKQATANQIPSGRLGTVRDIADATIYLFSEAGSYVNGEILVVDGGGWHTNFQPAGESVAYPDFFLSSEKRITGVKDGRRSRL
ncbi:NAD(P)-binding protein [Aspergillus granulosus]|uniref:2,4-dienoyl-CoA reductase [(3E)-enoyl-CoA-producing] n=1 Tax=Aspergillus granulosus TaxID=176169 RepID=A0ABR4H872_9EURO